MDALQPRRTEIGAGAGPKLRREVRNVSVVAAPMSNLPSFAAKDLTARLATNTRAAAMSGTKDDALRALDKTLRFYPGRGIERFFQSRAIVPAAESLAAERIQRVIVATGFSVDRRPDGSPLPETDGPIGAAALVHALQTVGKMAILVTDNANYAPTKAALNVINPELAKNGMFIKFDHAQGEGAVTAAQHILSDTHADAVVTIELPGRTEGGERRNMRGVEISSFNGAVDQLLIEANKKDLLTVSVGDGGNEAGMGGLEGIPNALDGQPMQAGEAARHQVTASVSNLGGEALAAVLLKAYGKLDKLHTPAQQTRMIQETMKAGAVDGVTRGSVAGKTIESGATTGVDGFHPEVHAAILGALKEQVALAPVTSFNMRVPSQPMLIAAFDSSDGGLHAVKVLQDLKEVRYPHIDIRFVAVLDHAKAPYGPRSAADLTGLVDKGLQTGAKLGVDVNMFACNTASTVLPREQFEAGKPAAAVPYINLIDTTVGSIVKHGGSHPLILATQATVDSHAYQKEGSAQGVTIRELAAPKWAGLINNGDLDKPLEGIKVRANIAAIVDQIPQDTTTVWLCCTHFPAFHREIENRLEARGLKHVQVVNPMVSQLDATIKVVEDLFKDPGVMQRRERRRLDLNPLVVTSSTQGIDNVSNSVKELLGDKTSLVRTSFNPEKTNVSLTNWHLNDPKIGTPLQGAALERRATVPSFLNA